MFIYVNSSGASASSGYGVRLQITCPSLLLESLWVFSYEEAIQLHYGTSVVLCRCPLMPAILHGEPCEIFLHQCSSIISVKDTLKILKQLPDIGRAGMAFFPDRINFGGHVRDFRMSASDHHMTFIVSVQLNTQQTKPNDHKL